MYHHVIGCLTYAGDIDTHRSTSADIFKMIQLLAGVVKIQVNSKITCCG